MATDNKEKLQALSGEIEEQRLRFQLEAEKKLLNNVNSSLEDILNGQEQCVSLEKADTDRADASDSDNKEKNDGKKFFIPGMMKIMLAVYGLILLIALAYPFFSFWATGSRHICNNVCIVLVTVLVLATVVLVLSGRYCALIYQMQLENERMAKKDTKKDSGPELSFKEKVLKRTQEAFLEYVVKDTIDSFNK